MLSAKGIVKEFGPVRALDMVDLDIPAGQVTALLGENGAGKSTLLKILSGDYQPTGGHLELDGHEVKFAGPLQAQANGVRVIAQEPEIIPYVSVAENIFVGAVSSMGVRFSRRRLQARAQKELVRCGFDKVLRPDALGRDLSPAQRQIVEIVRALVGNPQIICFDEPTSSLGDEEVDSLFALIGRLKDEGHSIAYVSHRMKEIFRIADRVTVLRDGRLVGTKNVKETSSSELVKMMVGRDLSQMFQSNHAEPGEVTLELMNVTTDDVTDVSLSVRAGEVVGIAGLIGAGRSELLRAVAGDLPVREGVITFRGRKVHFRSPADAIRLGICLAPEERKADALIMTRTVRDNVSLAVLHSMSRFFFVNRRAERELVHIYIDQLHVRASSIEQLVKNLSGGNQQKVVLARWLADKPKVLLLDEPTRGVDVGAKAEIYSIIDDLAASGVAIVVVSSDLPEILGLSDRIYVMAHGRVQGEISREDATEEAILSLAMRDENSPRSAA